MQVSPLEVKTTIRVGEKCIKLPLDKIVFLGSDAVLKSTASTKVLVILTFTPALVLLASFTSPAYAAILELPYPEPYLLINDSIVGAPIGAGNTLFILSVDGEVYANNTFVFKTSSPPSTLDFDTQIGQF